MSILRLPNGQQVRVLVFSSLLLLAACGEKSKQAGPGEMKVPVSVVTVQPTPTEFVVELPGRVSAIKDAEIRARVTGIVNEINFEQGSDVKAGQLLFTIDPSQYRAVRDQAAAQLQRAQADAKSARLLSQRYAKLIKANAVSQQEYDNAVAAAGQADANIAAAKATLKSAEIDLGYTKVDSPIDGRIGKSLITEGALVSATAATELATVQQIDRVYIDITRSTTEVAELRRALANGVLEQSADGNAKVQAVLENGSAYEHSGKLLFSGISVDPTTGQVNLRAEFPNPNEILLPGMYVRVRLPQGMDSKALNVPQQALQRTADGRSSLMLVKEGKIRVVPVTVGPESKGNWLITKGLSAGDVVVVEGFQKIRPGSAVEAKPWNPQAGTTEKTPPAAPEPAAKG